MAGTPSLTARGDRSVLRALLPMLRGYRGRLVMTAGAAAAGPLLLAARIWLLKILIDDALVQHRPGLLLALAGAFAGIALTRALLASLTARCAGAAGAGLVRDLRARVMTVLQDRSLTYLRRHRLGDLLTRLSADAAAVEDVFVSGLPTLVSNVVTVVVFSALLTVLDPRLLLVALAIVPVLAAAVAVDARRGRRIQTRIREASSELTSTAEQALSAIATVKAFTRGRYEADRYATIADHAAGARLSAVRLRATIAPLTELIAALGTAAVVWIGGRQVLAGQLSIGSLVIFLSYLGSLYAPLQSLGRQAGTTQRALVGATRIADLLTTPPTDNDRQAAGTTTHPAGRGPGSLRFESVSFAYPGAARPAVTDVSYHVNPGEIVALVGPSGAGKTTLVSLLLAFYAPDRGRIRLGNIPLSELAADQARAPIAAVLQEPMLFDDTITANIRYGNLDATDTEIRRAAALAAANEFITALPGGYATRIGPRGADLSGGQRQRLAIARALVKDAPVLVLDEATSALDAATEDRVLTGIRRAGRHRATLLVTHRPSALRHADRVLTLTDGRIIGDTATRAANRSQASADSFGGADAVILAGRDGGI